ncbi:SHOCT domain-containing protein [Streptomyces sp. CRN 30]|uniref:SHOCT domain-containing protein n=1 Tax=Streptomyces sp. CRN 30 TaxID=3075613 RepID=UPI002A80D3D7|nr:SHOCT domain-containing protein [Streptomyces sp. CRN 30]
MMYGDGHGYGAWGWFAMSLGALLFLCLLFAGVMLLAQVARRAAGRDLTYLTPERLLAERFARGEIDEEEYERRSAVLRAERPSAPRGNLFSKRSP